MEAVQKHGLATALAIVAALLTIWILDELTDAAKAVVVVFFLALCNGLALFLSNRFFDRKK